MSAPDTEDPGASLPGPLRRTFASLRYPNYRLWFGGHLVSLLGTHMQATAQGFLVFELTRSPAFLGYVGFAQGLPSWLLMLYGGVVADRVSRRGLLTVTQGAMALQAAALAALTFAGLVQAWHIVALALLLGVVNAFDAPARQAFVLELVERESLTNAIALNSTIFHSATTVGPAVAGLVYAAAGPSWCFGVNALSYLAVIGALLAMRLPHHAAVPPTTTARRALAEGLRFVATETTVRLIVALVAATSLFGLGIVTLMPAWAVRILRGGSRLNGLLYSARGLGALSGALTIAWLGGSRARGRVLTAATLLAPALMAVFAVLRWVPASLLALVATGFSLMLVFNLCNALVQTAVPDELRGRVMSIYTLTFFGLMPLGSLLAGTAAAHLGEPATVLLNAGLFLACALAVQLGSPRLRRLH